MEDPTGPSGERSVVDDIPMAIIWGAAIPMQSHLEIDYRTITRLNGDKEIIPLINVELDTTQNPPRTVMKGLNGDADMSLTLRPLAMVGTIDELTEAFRTQLKLAAIYLNSGNGLDNPKLVEDYKKWREENKEPGALMLGIDHRMTKLEEDGIFGECPDPHAPIV